MVRINKGKLNAEQVNSIILLVRENNGNVYHSTKREEEMELDLSLLRLVEKVKLFFKVQQIKREKAST